MYTIILGKDGKYHCQFRLQDSTEYYTEDTLEEAVKHAIKFARVLNGTKITKRDIRFLREEPVTETKLVPWQPYERR